MKKEWRKKRMDQKINCECCGKELVKFGSQKFCNQCALFTDKLRKKLSQYKNSYKKLKKTMWINKRLIKEIIKNE